MVGGSWREGLRWTTGEEDRMLRRGAAMKKGEGCRFWKVVGGLRAIYPEGELCLAKGDWTHLFCDCVEPLVLAGCSAFISHTGTTTRRPVTVMTDLGRKQIGRDHFKLDKWKLSEIWQHWMRQGGWFSALTMQIEVVQNAARRLFGSWDWNREIQPVLVGQKSVGVRV